MNESSVYVKMFELSTDELYQIKPLIGFAINHQFRYKKCYFIDAFANLETNLQHKQN